MLKAHRVASSDWSKDGSLADGVVWVDLIDPSEAEKAEVERITGHRIPDEQALSEIEASSRLIFENNTLCLSSPAVKLDDRGEPTLTSIGYIIDQRVLITIRFSASAVFDRVEQRVKESDDLTTGMCVFTAILEAVVDRGADVLENLGSEADRLGRAIFKGSRNHSQEPVRTTSRLRHALTEVGALADRLSMARDVLLGTGRIASFANDIAQDWITPSSKRRLNAVLKDVASLSDYETRVSDKIQLLLDAVLGFINIEQNDLFRILTIVSVVGVPPTLLAGIWGMNFKHMPELDWPWGYAFAWAAIIASALLPLVWFKVRGWFD